MRTSKRCTGWGPGRGKEIVGDVVGRRVAIRADVALGHLREELQRDGIGIGDLVAGEGLPRAVRIVGHERVVDGEGVAGEIARSLRGGGHGEIVGAVVALFVGVLVIAEEEQLVVQDGAADCAAFLVAMEGRRRVAIARIGGELALLVEVLIGGQNIGAEDAERVAVKAYSCPTWSPG